MLCEAVNTDSLVPYTGLPLMLLSIKDEYLVREPYPGVGDAFAGGPSATTIQLGEHPIGQSLRALGVGAFGTLMTVYFPHQQSLLTWACCTPLF